MVKEKTKRNELIKHHSNDNLQLHLLTASLYLPGILDSFRIVSTVSQISKNLKKTTRGANVSKRI